MAREKPAAVGTTTYVTPATSTALQVRARAWPVPTGARPLEPHPGTPSPEVVPLDPDEPVPDDPGPLEEPEILPPPPLEPSPDVLPAPEPV